MSGNAHPVLFCPTIFSTVRPKGVSPASRPSCATGRAVSPRPPPPSPTPNRHSRAGGNPQTPTPRNIPARFAGQGGLQMLRDVCPALPPPTTVIPACSAEHEAQAGIQNHGSCLVGQAFLPVLAAYRAGVETPGSLSGVCRGHGGPRSVGAFFSPLSCSCPKCLTAHAPACVQRQRRVITQPGSQGRAGCKCFEMSAPRCRLAHPSFPRARQSTKRRRESRATCRAWWDRHSCLSLPQTLACGASPPIALCTGSTLRLRDFPLHSSSGRSVRTLLRRSHRYGTTCAIGQHQFPRSSWRNAACRACTARG